jgi:hypothetical protein
MKESKLILIALLGVLVSACGDDDTAAPEVKTFTFSVPAGKIDAYENRWIILSNDAGTVLDYKQLHNGVTYAFDSSPDMTEQDVNFSILTNQDNGADGLFTSVDTYTDIPFGEYGYPKTIAPQIAGTGVLDLEGVKRQSVYGSLKYTVPWGTTCSYSSVMLPNAGEGVRFSVTSPTEKMGLLLTTSSWPPSYLYTEMAVNENYNHSMSDFQVGDVTSIDVPEADQISIQLGGVNSRGVFTYLSGPATVEGGVSSVPVFDDVFDAYETSITATTLGEGYDIYYFKGNSVPARMKMLDVTFDLTIEGDVLSWQTTGAADAAFIDVQKYEPETKTYFMWAVFGNGKGATIALPKIPSDIPLIGNNTERTFTEVRGQRSFETQLWESANHTSHFDLWVTPYLTLDPPAVEFTEYRIRIEVR